MLWNERSDAQNYNMPVNLKLREGGGGICIPRGAGSIRLIIHGFRVSDRDTTSHTGILTCLDWLYRDSDRIKLAIERFWQG